LTVRRQHFGADRDDLCVHSKQCSKTRLFVPDSLWSRPARQKVLGEDLRKAGQSCLCSAAVCSSAIPQSSKLADGGRGADRCRDGYFR
jgi:hypothetical protein